MTDVDVKALAGVFILEWKNQGIRVRVSHLVDHRDELSAEVAIGVTSPVRQVLHTARLNLLSTQSRGTLARYLKERQDYDWAAVLEELCLIVIARWRAGEPMVELGHQPKRESIPWRVYPILLERQPTILYGPGATGKSFFALYLALLLRGKVIEDDYVGQNGLKVEPGPVLLLDWETDQDEMEDRLRGLIHGMGLEMPDNIEIHYRRQSRPLAQEIEGIQQQVMERNVQTIIVDSMVGACGGDMEGAGDINNYFSALRVLNLSSLTIDHVNKAGDLYGNVYKYNRARSVFEVKKAQEPEENAIHLALHHRKINNGPLMKPFGYTILFEGDAVRFKRLDIKSIPVLEEGMHVHERIKNYLTHAGKSTVVDISESLKIPVPDVRTTLNRYTDLFTHQGTLGRENLWGVKAVQTEQGGFSA